MRIRFLGLLMCLLVLTTIPGLSQTEDQRALDKGDEKEQATATTASQTTAAAVLDTVRVGGLWYLSFQGGDEFTGIANETETFSNFRIKRGYLNVRANIKPWLEVRFTPDVHQEANGDVKVRMKYAYGKFKFKGNNIINKPYVEFGISHMPWLDFEEHINRFRMQDTMFMERNGLFNSADFGFTWGSNFGLELSDDYKENVSDHYAGRYGSWQFGVYNGGGYHAVEKNRNKVVEARGTVRPLPDTLPGLQFSAFGIFGKGNLSDPEPPEKLPNYRVLSGMVSYEHEYVVLTGQFYDGEGNAKGSFVRSDGTAREQHGFSFFTEVRLNRKRNLSLIARYDWFDTDSENDQSDVKKRTIIGFAWEMFKHNYWVIDYDRLAHKDPTIPTEDRFQITLQVSF